MPVTSPALAMVPGAPGGPELLIILFMLGMFVVLPLAIALRLLGGESNEGTADSSLESRVAELEQKFEDVERENAALKRRRDESRSSE